MSKNYVESFYAVTISSIYMIKDMDEHGKPYVEMIASKGNAGKMTVGQRLKHQGEGKSIVVIFYVISMTTEDIYSFFTKTCESEDPEDRMRVKYLGGHTDSIVALFKEENEARKCFEIDNLQQRDSRWITQTKQVLSDIGPDHPNFKIATEDYRLIRD